ncbi:hypothetical protein SD70_06815 [Gordoniibacillus kamchatkensis]|uniref:Cysteine dioxygenase n=1 Tax=Gordoniibacillus kamchatkensis TaxID=1590651 RepID=A0ABR5AKI7_9BACL|nr:cysteine dioxygenase family protein [Paenibacillus sp. VKM B-2647]KIL41564.1 hypothetical protein SD70_06815 [Paenibacillus sp. VKM B-2647]
MQWLNRLQKELDALRAPTAAELFAALQAAPCTKEDLAAFVTEPEAGRAYGRNVLYRSNHVEAIVVHLPPGAATSVHDHGDSVGCAKVVEGELCNAIYRKSDYGMAAETGAVTVAAGKHVFAPHGQIHQMRSSGNGRTVSLHLYAPPIAGMKIYVPEELAVLDYVI